MKICKKSWLCWMIVLFVIACESMQAQRRVEFKFVVGDETGTEVNLTAGIDDRATDSLDMGLGEQFTPGHPGFFLGIVSAGILIENNLSYKSYRRIPSKDTFALDYVVNVNNYEFRKIPFFFKWNYPLPQFIDSARIIDPFNGVLYSIPLDESRKSMPITNEGLNNYILRIWYAKIPVDVKENELENKATLIGTRWQNDELQLNVPEWSDVEIINVLGVTHWKNKEESGERVFNTSALPNGIYFIRATNMDGIVLTKKIILTR